MYYKSNKYIFIFFFLLIATAVLFYINSNVAFSKIENIKSEKYHTKSNNISNRVETLIKDKANSTLALALILAEDKAIKTILNTKQYKNLNKLTYNSLQLRKHSDFKNVWFHIIDNKGISRYRSWAKKRGDSILKIRMDVVEMLEKPRTMSTISTGKFDMTFKAMVPIYENKKFIGIVEVITHFNSISRKLAKSGIDTVILVDKKYKKQLKKPFTKMFVDDYYVANVDAKKELREYIQRHGVENFVNTKQYILKDNYFISFYQLPDMKKNPMGYFIFFQHIDSVDITEIESFKFVSKVIITSLIAFFIFGIFLILFLARKNQIEAINHTLKQTNLQLEETIKHEVEKSRKKDMLLQKQNRLIALGEMLENIAHQWRQPLSAISTSASGLKLRLESPQPPSQEETFELLDAIVNNTMHLSMTIEDFRNFFVKDKAKENFNIAHTITKSYNIVKALFISRAIEIEFILDKSITYNGYEREFAQVIINLLNNAKDAFENKNIDDKIVKVSLSKNEKNKKIIVSVLDNAGGVPLEINEKIFDPYFTTKHQSKGTGIGLYMCQEIILDHFKGTIHNKNQSIYVKNKKYSCANFIIELPL